MVHKKPSADLQADYKKALEVGIIVALGLAIAAFKFFPDVEPPPPIESKPGDPPIDLVPNTEHTKPAPPPPRLQPVIIESVGDIQPEDIEIDSGLDPLANVPPPPPVLKDDPPGFKEIFEIPEFVGGPSALAGNLIYPEMAKRIGHEGTVVLLAFVDERGTVVRAEIVHRIGLGCDEAAIAALMKTRFHPATQRDKPVKVKVRVPIRFRLQR